MAKQLIIVVHGVGVKEAGVSADLLATALDDTPESNEDLTRSDINLSRLRPHSSDDFHLREKIEYNSGGKRQVFPARIRRYRHNDEKSGKLLDERVVADFYWGDISNIASGLPGLLLGVLKTILGLSHIIRENADSVFPSDNRVDWAMRRIANLAALTIHGPIAAINIFLVLGVLVNFGLIKIGFANKDLPIWLTGIIAVGAGYFFSKKSDVYLIRHLFGWLSLTGLVFLLLWQFLPLGDRGLSVIGGISDTVIKSHVCGSLNGEALNKCIGAVDGIFAQGLRLIVLMGYLWLLVIACALALSVAELIRFFKGTHKNPPSIIAPAISLMTMLWIIMIGVIWAVIAKTPGELIPSSIPLESVLGNVVLCVVILLVIGVGAYISYKKTSRWGQTFVPSQYYDPSQLSVADDNANANRMIMSKWILWPIRIFLIVLVLFSLAETAALYGWEMPGLAFIRNLTFQFDKVFAAVLLGLATLGGFIAYSGEKPLRAGLGIAIDVITWLNDHSWNSKEKKTRATKTLFEKTVPWMFPIAPASKRQGYWKRERIKQRLEVLTNQMIRDERPDRLIIVSHSQGTVVALDVLNTLGRKWLSMMPEGSTISLATMGSPYNHVHHHYFPQSFAKISQCPELQLRRPDGKGGVLTDWINIFRIDDFVGTYIDPTGQWPREHPVAANGHTYYWIDENVFPILKTFVK